MDSVTIARLRVVKNLSLWRNPVLIIQEKRATLSLGLGGRIAKYTMPTYCPNCPNEVLHYLKIPGTNRLRAFCPNCGFSRLARKTKQGNVLEIGRIWIWLRDMRSWLRSCSLLLQMQKVCLRSLRALRSFRETLPPNRLEIIFMTFYQWKIRKSPGRPRGSTNKRRFKRREKHSTKSGIEDRIRLQTLRAVWIIADKFRLGKINI